MFIKIAAVFVLFVILGSLFSALFFLNKDKSGSDRTVKALTMRIGLSVVLFIGLIIAAYLGKLGHAL